MLDLISIRYVGGPANRTTGGATRNCHTIHYGNKGEEVTYRRTDELDDRGRVIFRVRADEAAQL